MSDDSELPEYRRKINKRVRELNNLFALSFHANNLRNYKAKHRLSDKMIDVIEDAHRILEENFPDRWDIQFKLEPYFVNHVNTYGSNHVRDINKFDMLIIKEIYFIIHFPQITITNNRKQNRTLSDIFIKFVVEPTMNPFFSCIKGLRTTISPIEYSAKYIHSHLPAKDWSILRWDNFCLGSGDISNSRSLLCAEYDPDILNLMFLQAETYLSWESLEGGPHILMESVINRDFSYPNMTSDNKITIYNYIIRMFKVGIRPDIDWKFANGKYSIIDNEKFEEFFRRFIFDNYRSYFIHKDEQGNYFTESTLDSGIINEVTMDKWIPFRGKKIPLKVVGEIKKATTDRTFYINPQIKNYVRARLEYKINSPKVRESAIK